MSPNLETRIRRYASHLDEQAPPVTFDEIIVRQVAPVRLRRVEERSRQTGSRPWWRQVRVAVGAALLILLLGGAVVLMPLLRGEPPVVDEPITSTTIPAPVPAGGPFSISIIDPGSDNFFPSVAVGSDGDPVVAYYQREDANLVIASCSDPNCTDGPTLLRVAVDEIPHEHSLVLGGRDAPVVAFSNWIQTGEPDPTMRVDLLVCADSVCSDYTITTIGTGQSPHLVTGANGLPVVLYEDTETQLPTLALCSDPACFERTTVPLELEPWGGTSLAIGSDGLPVIASIRNNPERRVSEVKVLHCDNPTCIEQTVNHVADGEQNEHSVAIAIGADGNPVVAFGTRQLQLLTCSDPACSSVDAVMNVGGRMIIEEGMSKSLSVGTDGNPVMAFAGSQRANEPGLPMVAACRDPQCATGTIATVDDTRAIGVSMTLNPNGYPVLAYAAFAELKLASCADPACRSGALEVTSWDQTPVTTTTSASVGPLMEGWIKVPYQAEVFGPGGGGGFMAVTEGGPGLVAVGNTCELVGGSSVCESGVWISEDGFTWERVPGTDFGGEIWDVAAGDPGLVAVGSTCPMPGPTEETPCDPAVWTSPDGSSWQRAVQVPGVFEGCSTLEDEAFGCQSWLEKVTVGGPGFVAAGQDVSGVSLWASADGVTWQRVPVDPETLPPGSWVTDILQVGSRQVALGTVWEDIYENGEWVDSRQQARVLFSEDGLVWAAVPDDQDIFTGASFDAPATTWEGGVSVPGSVCDQDWVCQEVIWNSPDGLTWSRSPFTAGPEEGIGMVRLAAGGPGLIGAGSSYNQLDNRETALFWTSSDGITWEPFAADPQVFPSGLGINDFAHFGDRLVGVGSSREDRAPGVWVWTP